MNTIKKIKDDFIGNKKAYIIWDEEKDRWRRSYISISDKAIRYHLDHYISIGSYAIYYKDDVPYCKWICVDIDSHGLEVPEKVKKEIREEHDGELAEKVLDRVENEYDKKIDKESKKIQEEFVNFLFQNSYYFFKTDQKHLIVEDSGGGYHIWIILKEDTPLEEVGKYLYIVRRRINWFYKQMANGCDMPEYYPKQYTTDHLEQGLGNGVRLPKGKNIKRDYVCKIILGDFMNIKRTDITNKFSDWNINIDDVEAAVFEDNDNSEHNLKLSEGKRVTNDWYFWLEWPLRPCFKKIITGEIKCHKVPQSHKARMALVQEMKYFDIPFNVMVEAFKNQPDFNRSKTIQQIKSVLRSSKGKTWRYSCSKIQQMGFCLKKLCDKYGY